MEETTKPLVSVIVPVYNAEKYIDRCVQSILCQTCEDFELILVNDGSKDASGTLCDAFASRDSRIKVIHQDNSGVSSARNAGLDIATGRYVMFADSDDYIENNMIQELICIMRPDTDLSVAATTMVWEDKQTTYSIEDGVYTTGQILEDFCLEKFPVICLSGPCAKLYRREIIQQHAIRFDIQMRLGEDTVFNMHFLEHGRSIATTGQTRYFYVRDNQDSLFSKFRDNWYSDSMKSMQSQYAAAKMHQCTEKAIAHIEKKYVMDFLPRIVTAVRTAGKESCLRYMRNVSGDPLFRNHIGLYRANIKQYICMKLVMNGRYETVYRIMHFIYSKQIQ